MLKRGKFLFGLLAISMSVSAVECKHDLYMMNNTSEESTARINGGVCSNILGDNGVSHPHSTNVIPGYVLCKACVFNRENCSAEIYMTSNCKGDVIATATVDVVENGIKEIKIKNPSSGYSLSGKGFYASINHSQPPAIIKWLKNLLG